MPVKNRQYNHNSNLIRMKILHLISSPQGETSNSKKLGNAIVEKLLMANPESELVVRNLNENVLPHLDETIISSFYTPDEYITPQLKEVAKQSDGVVAQVVNADVVVIGAPIYNYGIHSSLKVWIDHLVRVRKTVSFADGTPKGLITGKKVYLAVSSGAVFSEGYYKPFDFVEPYLRAALGLVGITDITTYRSEGTSMPGIMEAGLQNAIDSIAV